MLASRPFAALLNTFLYVAAVGEWLLFAWPGLLLWRLGVLHAWMVISDAKADWRTDRALRSGLTNKRNVAGHSEGVARRTAACEPSGMRPNVALLCSLLLALVLAGHARAQQSASFQAGADDRAAFEQWFSGLSSEYRSGAEYWVAHRSVPRGARCTATGDQLAGCQAAQQRLAPIDARRRAEPDYRLGWNSVQAPLTAQSSYQPPAPETLYHVQRNTYGCQNSRAALALTNPLEPRRSDPGWVNNVINDGVCASITPNSSWRMIRHEGHLVLMSYAGTTGRPGTFYLRESDLSAPVAIPDTAAGQVSIGSGGSAPAATFAPPAAPSAAPMPSTTANPPSQSSTPSSGYLNPPLDDSSSRTQPAAPIFAGPAPATPVVQTSSGGSYTGWLIFIGIVAIVALIFFLKSSAERARVEAANARRRKATTIAFGEISEKAHLLHVRREQLTQPDFYGTIDTAKWEKEKVNFIQSRVVPLLNDTGMGDLTAEVLPVIFAEVEAAAWRPIAEATRETFSNPEVYSPDMDPIHYEIHCARQLGKAGWTTKATPRTGDQGADVLADRRGVTLVVQCKLYSSNVGNGAVQEAIAARTYHRTDLAAVVSNAAFTKSARELAGMSDVTLLHHSQLPAYTGASGPREVMNAAD